MKYTKIYRTFIILSLAALCSLAWSANAKKVEEKTFRFTAGGDISIYGDEGSIIVTTWDKDEVYLKMTKRAWGRSQKEADELLAHIEVDIRESKGRLVIKELDFRNNTRFNFFDLFDGDFWREKGWRSKQVEFELKVPVNVHLKLRSDEGDVEVTGTNGGLIIAVDEGNVSLETIVSQDLEIQVDEGNVKLIDIRSEDRGYWKMSTDEGAIRIEDGNVDEADIHSDEGNIYLKDITIERFWLSTDEGDIVADFIPKQGGQYRMETDEGDCEIRLSDDLGLHVRIQSDEGRIDTDFDLKCRRLDDGELCEGVIGTTEEGSLRAYTDEGEIFLIKR